MRVTSQTYYYNDATFLRHVYIAVTPSAHSMLVVRRICPRLRRAWSCWRGVQTLLTRIEESRHYLFFFPFLFESELEKWHCCTLDYENPELRVLRRFVSSVDRISREPFEHSPRLVEIIKCCVFLFLYQDKQLLIKLLGMLPPI